MKVNNVEQVQLINGVIEGSGFNQRTGRKISMMSHQIDGWIIATSVNPGNVSAQFARVALVYDRQSNGTTPSWQDVFQDQDYAAGVSSNVLSHVNMNNRERFVILRDWLHFLPNIGINGANPGNAAGIENPQYSLDTKFSLNFKEMIKLGGLASIYGASSNPPVFGDLKSGGLFLIVKGQDAAAVANSAFHLIVTMRTRFVD